MPRANEQCRGRRQRVCPGSRGRAPGGGRGKAPRFSPYLIPLGVFKNKAGFHMTKARQPEIVFIPQGLTPKEMRDRLDSEGMTLASAPRAGLNVLYPDRRVLPRTCQRTGMRRDFCCCHPCRARRRRKHQAPCACWLCYADRMGGFIDELGSRTAAGGWKGFLTLTYRTRNFPWPTDFR